MIACAAFTQKAFALTVPTPTASKGTYSSYVKVSWSRVSGAKGYFIRRGTSSSYSKSTQLTRINSGSTTSYCDSSASSGKTYYYWVCPIEGTTYWYSTGRYASGYRKSSGSTNSGSTHSYSYYMSLYNTYNSKATSQYRTVTTLKKNYQKRPLSLSARLAYQSALSLYNTYRDMANKYYRLALSAR